MTQYMADRSWLIESLEAYHSAYPAEDVFRAQFLVLLKHPRAFFRDHLPGHMTASSWIIGDKGKFALLTHHAKLDRWLQPGGHADGDENILAVARKEAREETGLATLELLNPQIFDIDIHPIPARSDFPRHFHYDIRFLFRANMNESFTVTAESKNLAWIPVEDLASRTGANVSIMRMAEKVKALLGADQQ
ncbi:MAG TPA: NUDIX hydrolase [Chryseosolibacter sp.]